MSKVKKLLFLVPPLILAVVFTVVVILINGSGKLTKHTLANRSTFKTMQSGEVVGRVQRNIPEVSDEGLERYPVYGTTLSLTDEEKQAILDENAFLNASDTTYDSMDGEGNLYLNGSALGRKLYKHTAAAGLYYGDVSDDEQAVIKRLSYNSRPAGNHITGLYAPAGEVIKISMSNDDLQRTGGLTVHIGQALSNGQANNIWLAKNFNRMPVILNTMTVSETTAYVGSYLGGPIYIRPKNSGVEFSVEISGGVEYSHFILGLTTEEEFNRTKDSTAPYFDLEVWDRGVRHSGPKIYAQSFDYEALYKVAVLWDKISAVSTRVPSGSNSSIGIDFLYDPFVAAGLMVAFVGRNTVNCPASTLQNALNYESCVNDGFWGIIHEYNHHFQRFGFAPGDEVTNNAVSLVEYSLFTNISSGRNAADTVNNGLRDWNRYTNADWTLKQTISKAGGAVNQDLDGYANILHCFGQDAFIKATQNGRGAGGADTWYKAVSDATGQDVSFYFTQMLNASVSESVLAEYAQRNYPVFVPVSSIYQTGVKRGEITAKTMLPYQIDGSVEIDFGTCITLPEGFGYTVKNISAPEKGEMELISEGVYVYSLNGAESSGEIEVSLGIIKEDGAFEVDDVTLVFEFAQNQKKNILSRRVMIYDDADMYESLADAASNGFAGYSEIIEEDNLNPVQDSNTEIWGPNPGRNAIMEVSGKLEITDTARYRLAVRGRYSVQLYISTDGKSYELAVDYLNTSNSPAFDLTDPTKYVDLELNKGSYLYFKTYLLVTQENCFVGLGFGKFNGDEVSVSYLNAWRSDYEKKEFDTDYFYTKALGYTVNDILSVKETLISYKYEAWDDTKLIGNLFDEDKTNAIHSNKKDISEENPFEIVVELDRSVTANRFTVVGDPTRVYLPTAYKLYLGNGPEDMSLVADVTGAAVANNSVSVSFPMQSFRYYRLTVTDTSAVNQQYRYIAFRGVEFSVYAPNGEQASPDEERFSYYGSWSQESVLSTFGHVNYAKSGEIRFEFNGTRFAISSLCGESYGKFKVYVDGELVATPTLSSSLERVERVFLSGELSDTVHSVKIVFSEGFNIESFIFW